MAGRPRKVTTEVSNTDTASVTVVNNTSSEMEELKKENAELKEQMKLILEKLNVGNEAKATAPEPENISYSYDDDEGNFVEINPMKPIRVVSLSDGGVNLKTAKNGGKVFRLDKFGHSTSITYSDLQDVIATCRPLIENGTVYICNKDVVRNNYLEENYKHFLTVDTISNILSFNTEQIVDMVKNTTEPIQESIISLVVKKINNGENVDMNKVNAIGNACKTPCDIMALAVKLKA